MAELKPCPFCGAAPRLLLCDDTYEVVCDHHDWTERDDDGVCIAGDIGVYSCAKSRFDATSRKWIVNERSLAAARCKVVELWNTRVGERNETDLIEPQERTCRMKLSDCTDSLGQKMYRCSECGALMTDDACFFEGEPDIDWFSYCPNCGAMVIADE